MAVFRAEPKSRLLRVETKRLQFDFPLPAVHALKDLAETTG